MDLQKLLEENRPALVFTGAGMSQESGIPTFRGKGGLWEDFNPEDWCTLEVFKKDPSKVWKLIGMLGKTCHSAVPNIGHKILARMEADGLVSHIVTQNVDGLHQKAGSKKVIEIHGNINATFCTTCRRIPVFLLDIFPPRCGICRSIVKPGITLFGEGLPPAYDHALNLAAKCTLMVTIGTSGLVEPAASIPRLASYRCPIIEINPNPTGIAAATTTIVAMATEGLQQLTGGRYDQML